MSLGRLWLKKNQTFQHGLRAAYWRDIVRPRILATPPISNTVDVHCEIHVLTSKDDWLNLVWTLKTFYWKSERNYALCIHDDGSLNAHAIEELTHHFPNARLIARPEADNHVTQRLKAFPNCAAFRQSNLLAPKLFDFKYYLSSERMLLLDSDVLFFETPKELLQRIDDTAYLKNTVNRDIASAYTVTEAAAQSAGVTLIEQFNSGLGLIHASSLRFDWIEEFLALPGIIGSFWRIEQTLYALLSSRHGVELLPAEYNVDLTNRHLERPVRHYVGAIRHLMYRDGIRTLVNQGILKQSRHQASSTP